MPNVFVYGTLRTDGSAHHLIAEYVHAVAPGEVRGQLTEADGYPALLPNRDGTVHGEWLTLDVEALPVMDEWEEYYGPGHPRNVYERVAVTDVDGCRQGWVYIRS